MLSNKEIQFLKDLMHGDISQYEGNYPKVLKSRILKKWAAMSEHMTLINDAMDKLKKV
jgi:hypothetical protein